MDMNFLRYQSPGYHLMHMVYKFNGPARPDTAHLLPRRGLMMGFMDDERRETEFERHHLQLSKFLNFAAMAVSPMPPAWIAVVGDTGYVFKPDSDGSWLYALAIATQHKLASMSMSNYRKEDYQKPTITFVPFEYHGFSSVIKFAYKVTDLPSNTQAYIEAEPRTYNLADVSPATQASLEADPKFLLRLELMSSVIIPAGQQYNVFKMKKEETSPQE